jgi:hypothetical protein
MPRAIVILNGPSAEARVSVARTPSLLDAIQTTANPTTSFREFLTAERG